mmetsp:Transcript_116698/g.330106  ORF Transcript_116698/g.330106 Transcript_116698/m.330106 type:complete len:215 (+) Transcript_116698:1043-1687(+)
MERVTYLSAQSRVPVDELPHCQLQRSHVDGVVAPQHPATHRRVLPRRKPNRVLLVEVRWHCIAPAAGVFELLEIRCQGTDIVRLSQIRRTDSTAEPRFDDVGQSGDGERVQSDEFCAKMNRSETWHDLSYDLAEKPRVCRCVLSVNHDVLGPLTLVAALAERVRHELVCGLVIIEVLLCLCVPPPPVKNAVLLGAILFGPSGIRHDAHGLRASW